MFSECISCFRFSNAFLKKQLEDVPADQLDSIPSDGHKAPRWILGHLAEGHYYLVMFLGLEEQFPFPESWAKAFAPGTASLPPYGLDESDEVPPSDGLLDYIRQTEQPIIDAAVGRPGRQHGRSARHRNSRRQFDRHASRPGRSPTHIALLLPPWSTQHLATGSRRAARVLIGDVLR